jgi:hypothetical protein
VIVVWEVVLRPLALTLVGVVGKEVGAMGRCCHRGRLLVVVVVEEMKERGESRWVRRRRDPRWVGSGLVVVLDLALVVAVVVVMVVVTQQVLGVQRGKKGPVMGLVGVGEGVGVGVLSLQCIGCRAGGWVTLGGRRV